MADASPNAPPTAFPVCLDVLIRPCREEDLPALEWFGLFTPQRPLIRRVFAQHQRGEAVMLVVEANGEASGQLWIDLVERRAAAAGVIWAVRVLPCLQGLGIGTRLLAAAEDLLLQRGLARAELGVETDNPGARRLYERLGYVLVGTRSVGNPPETADPSRRTQWLMAKELRRSSRLRSACDGPWAM